jgi:hypothetical protein
MNKTLIAATLLAVVFSALTGLSGCKSDPHEQHITTGIAAPR